MPVVHGLPPIADTNARLLILGSMPGVESLQAQQYYAHPRNQFWPIMGELYGAVPTISYPERCRILRLCGVAVWDVIQSCERDGSLDSAIVAHSIEPNRFNQFFSEHPAIRTIIFNGTKAEHCFIRHVKPDLQQGRLTYHRLPSTSPAHASLNFSEKLVQWRQVCSATPFLK